MKNRIGETGRWRTGDIFENIGGKMAVTQDYYE